MILYSTNATPDIGILGVPCAKKTEGPRPPQFPFESRDEPIIANFVSAHPSDHITDNLVRAFYLIIACA